MNAKPLNSLNADNTPPGGGRTFFETEKSPKNMGFCAHSSIPIATQIDGTKRETGAGMRGKSGDSVRALIEERAVPRDGTSGPQISKRGSPNQTIKDAGVYVPEHHVRW